MSRVFLDVDGVLADFVRQVSEWYDVPIADMPKQWDILPYVASRTGHTRDGLWAEICREYTFWSSMPETAECHLIIEALKDHRVTFCTSVPFCMAEAREQWLLKRWPDARIIITNVKSEISGSGILIDDKLKTVQSYWETGGKAILWPTDQNGSSKTIDEKITYLKLKLAEFKRMRDQKRAGLTS